MIIFGLGNPGRLYRFTRHNAGRLFVEYIAKQYRRTFHRRKDYSAAHVRIKGKEVVLIKPKCWMNQCGEKIQGLIRPSREDFMVVVDDINLPAGRIRLRSKGSDGGHLGLRSVISAMQTEDFPRLRIGIGQTSMDAEDYVLGRFTADERKVLRSVMKEAVRGIEIMFGDNFVKAQNYINAINVTDID